MKQLYKLLMLGIVSVTAVMFLYIFITAYTNESKTTLVDINSVNEANIEMFVLVPLTLICIIYLFYDNMKEVSNTYNTK